MFPSGKAAGSGKLQDYADGLHAQYGPIVSLPMGEKTFVFIKDGRLVKKLYAKEEFMERPIEELYFAKKLVSGIFRGSYSLRFTKESECG